MLGTRYEEYIKFDDNRPFLFAIGIERTPYTYSHETNWHENLEIQICTDGEGTVFLDEKKLSVVKDDIIVVNSNVIHHTNSSNKIKYNCLIIDSGFCKSSGIDHTKLCFNSYIKSDYFCSLFRQLENLCTNDDTVCKTAKMKIIILEMLIELRENHVISEKFYEKKQSFETVKATIRFIRNNYSKKLLLDEISKAVFMDKYSLSREFKKVTGKTIVEYINHYRCMKAAEYISDGKSVAEAAIICGFTNMSFFTRTFKQYMGVMPSKYKQYKL